MLLCRAATTIAALGRGRLGRRRALTWRCVRIVSTAHPSLLHRAITTRTEKMRVKWYPKDQAKVLMEVSLLARFCVVDKSFAQLPLSYPQTLRII